MALRIGSSEPTAFYIGETAVTAIYVGETLVWSATTPPSSRRVAAFGSVAHGSGAFGG